MTQCHKMACSFLFRVRKKLLNFFMRVDDAAYRNIMVERGDKVSDILGDIHLMEPLSGAEFWSPIGQVGTQHTINNAFFIRPIKLLQTVGKDRIGGVGENTACFLFFQFVSDIQHRFTGRNDVIGGSVRSSADLVKAIALGADAVYIATAALLALGCHLCRTCQTGRCNWGIATQRPDLVRRLNPDLGCRRLVNLVTAWDHELKEMMGGMGINSIEALRGNRLMLRGIGLNQNELDILGVKYAGE